MLWPHDIVTISAALAMAQPQSSNVALNKTVFMSSEGGGSVIHHLTSAANDGDWASDVFTESLPWSFAAVDLEDTYETSNGSWRQGIKGEMTCTVYVALVWNIIYWIMMIITLFTE